MAKQHKSQGDKRTYTTYNCMKQRVKSNPRYKNIEICERWLESYENFVSDMGYRPEDCPITGKYSIDRIDNEAGYCKENCRWATPKEQANNKSNKKTISIAGESYSLAEWITKAGRDSEYAKIRPRVNTYGWDPALALIIK